MTISPRRFLHKHSFSIAIFSSVVLFFFALGGLVVANGEPIQPEDSHVVVLRIDGEERTFPTRAATVGDLLEKQNISLGEFDVVEPTEDTYIDKDVFEIAIYRAKPLTIIDNEEVIRTLSPYIDDRKAVKAAGVQIAPEDDVDPEFSANIFATRSIGRTLQVVRANTTTVNLYGAIIEKRTKAATVGDVLAELAIVPAPDDTVSPNPATKVSNGLAIFITKFGRQLATVEQDIAFVTEVTEDSSLSTGAERVLQQGSPGKKVVTYEIELANGTEIGRKVLQETVVVQPVVQKVVRGTKPLFADFNADGIPARVFCGSPKQGNWKNINVGNAAAGRALAAERGWTGSEFDALLELFACESSWNERAGNPVSGAYGIPQSWPATKMASFGADYMTNPITQLRWGLNYIAARYGTPSAALQFHYRTNYY